jgi:hypothetical protein
MNLKEYEFAIRNKFSLKANFTVFKNEFENNIVLLKNKVKNCFLKSRLEHLKI